MKFTFHILLSVCGDLMCSEVPAPEILKKSLFSRDSSMNERHATSWNGFFSAIHDFMTGTDSHEKIKCACGGVSSEETVHCEIFYLKSPSNIFNFDKEAC